MRLIWIILATKVCSRTIFFAFPKAFQPLIETAWYEIEEQAGDVKGPLLPVLKMLYEEHVPPKLHSCHLLSPPLALLLAENIQNRLLFLYFLPLCSSPSHPLNDASDVIPRALFTFMGGLSSFFVIRTYASLGLNVKHWVEMNTTTVDKYKQGGGWCWPWLI